MDTSATRSPAPTGPPRIAPLPSAAWGNELAGVADVAGALNVFTTIGRNAGLFAAWIGFAAFLLLEGRLPARHREVAILRIAHHAECGYIRDQHEPLARDMGVTDLEIRALAGQAEHDWPPVNRLIVDAVDELHATGTLSDSVWEPLADHFDDAQLIELVMLIGHYQMLGWTLNALRVQPDDPVERSR